MPDFEDALVTYLSEDAGISALVDDRIFKNALPPKTGTQPGAGIPAISFNRVSADRIYTYDAYPDSDAWVSARVQVNCWAFTATEAMDIGVAVLAALSGYGGDMAGELIGSSFAVNEFDIFEVPTKFHRRILDFVISYDEAVPAESS